MINSHSRTIEMSDYRDVIGSSFWFGCWLLLVVRVPMMSSYVVPMMGYDGGVNSLIASTEKIQRYLKIFPVLKMTALNFL